MPWYEKNEGCIAVWPKAYFQYESEGSEDASNEGEGVGGEEVVVIQRAILEALRQLAHIRAGSGVQVQELQDTVRLQALETGKFCNP